MDGGWNLVWNKILGRIKSGKFFDGKQYLKIIEPETAQSGLDRAREKCYSRLAVVMKALQYL